MDGMLAYQRDFSTHKLTLEDRACSYARAFPGYPRMWFDKGWLMGVWCIGACYKRANPTLHGGYPGNFLQRLLALFPDIPPERTLHVFSGNTPASVGGIRVDLACNRTPPPSVCADAARLPFCANSFDLVIADPPYDKVNATVYGTKMINRSVVLHELRRVVTRGAFLAWLDHQCPMHRREDWQQIGAVMLQVSTNTRIRSVSLFEAVEPHL
jgi:hypothetical protein